LLAGTDGASRPFWSPDSRALGFFAQGKLKRIDPSGGAPQTITDAPNGSGGSWSSDDVIVFAPRGRGPLLRVPAAGGIATPVTTIDPNGAPEIHCCPSFLPDGRHFLFSVDSERPERYGVYVGNVETKDTRRLIEADSGAFAQPGYLLSLAGAGTLNAQRFDTGRLQLTGEAFALAENIGQGFSVSQNGVLCYSAGQRKHQLVWFDRHGDQMAAVSGLGNFRGPELAADDKRVAFEAFDSATSSASIWMQDLSRRITSRFALDPASQFSPIWAPDGSRLLFFTVRNGEGGLYHKNASGTGEEQLLTQSKVTSFEAVAKRPTDWSSDGHVILYDSWDGATKWDILALPLSTDGKPATPAPFLQTSFTERTARFSPDDRWVVYVSEESGKSEVYVQPFAKTGDKWKISTDGGFQPRWRRDGKELFYLAPDKKLMAVDVRTGPAFEAGTPRPLFEARVFDVSLWSLYDVSADGRQFLVTAVSQDGDSLRIAVVVNWIKALAAR
jgi:Tol biopolymer transport system component